MTDATGSVDDAPRSSLPIGGTVSATFRTFGQAPGAFVALSIMAALSAVINLTLVQPGGGFVRIYVMPTLVNTVVQCFPIIAMTYIAVRCLERRAYTFGTSLVVAGRRFGPVLTCEVLTILAFNAGLVLLVIPGIIVFIMFAVAVPVCALEGLGPLDSLKRSRDLTRDNRLQIFAACVIMAVLLIALVAAAFVATWRLGETWEPLINEMIGVVWTPIGTIFSAALYFALRKVKGYDQGIATVFD